jgi:hypothetical protein
MSLIFLLACCNLVAHHVGRMVQETKVLLTADDLYSQLLEAISARR